MTTIHDLAIELQRRGYWTEVAGDTEDESELLNIWDVTGEYKLSVWPPTFAEELFYWEIPDETTASPELSASDLADLVLLVPRGT